ncbi:iron-sulfur cluster repair di-iron protein [Gracilibacillus sp. S3-1-1]|uniref:Iron-sulfur cluster repair di-iron protein n=1 Tax=Gracilibacillus pellucidus TaxID=3095368 RepID=A0ACC6M3U7_9BACI|nr:iron-sulfur cluster repair di-iron protein [Gracilibacillus sp. S3-1-1]MDX8045629.1 iron-sulfur cluster repair di-iron protein [Gracilibacillus sp. S3-1-1]
MRTFQLSDTPANIVKVYPKASDIFKKEKIDFCCGGNQPLNIVLDKKNRKIDGEELIRTINYSYQAWIVAGNQELNWDNVRTSELIDYILSHHHQYLYEELTPLSQFVTKINRVHGTQHPQLQMLEKLYHQFKMEIESHMIEEENDLFPLILDYEKAAKQSVKEQLLQLQEVMIDDHQYVGGLLQQMNEITNNYQLPDDACNSFRITYARLIELEDRTYKHIHLENSILFESIA